jgi:hypothetical protein
MFAILVIFALVTLVLATTLPVSSVFVFAAIVIIYFVPTGIAMSRQHRNTAAIVAINILLGWMLLGWIVALIWSLTDNVVATQTVRIQMAEQP